MDFGLCHHHVTSGWVSIDVRERVLVKKPYFCSCGQPISLEETHCVDCHLYWDSKYQDDTADTWFMTDELRKKYILERQSKGGEKHETTEAKEQ